AKMRRNHRRWCEEIKRYGFDYADGVYAANLKELDCDALNVHNLDWTVAKAFEFLDSTNRDEPFFLYFSTTLHHGPAPWANQFSLEADPRMTGEGFVKEGFNVLPAREDVIRRSRKAGFKDNKAFGLWLDDGVGAILDKLDSLGIDQDTLVIFVSDHGSFRHGKATLHDYGMRVPMLLRWPGAINPGSKFDGLVANIDVLPTLVELAGAQIPNGYRVDGLSFRSVLQGSREPLREVLFGELGHSRCVKTADWKYIAVRYPPDVQAKIDAGKTFNGFEGQQLPAPYLTRNGHLGHFASKSNPNYFEPDQLYDLQKDKEENENVVRQYPEHAERMREMLKEALLQFPDRPFGELTN
ncbi:MAG: sulfatase-like hydrolase/transferase, partial [Verrucomicrobiota bacterium]